MKTTHRVLLWLGKAFAVLFALSLYGEFSMYSRAGWHLSDVTLTSEPVLVALVAAAPAVAAFALARVVGVKLPKEAK